MLRELRERMADGYSLPQFTGFYADDAPCIMRSTAVFHPRTSETVKIVNGAVVQAVVELALEDGAKLRVDTMAVETAFIVHQPTDMINARRFGYDPDTCRVRNVR